MFIESSRVDPGACAGLPSGVAASAAVASSASSAASAASPGEPTLEQLEAQLTELSGHLNAATHRWLMLLAEFDRRQGWADGFTRSCAHWLAWKCGIDRGAAREKLRVARALQALPAIGAAMARGELSYAKVRALTRVASVATEDALLTIALHGTADHVEQVVRGYRRATEAAELSREARQHAGRALSYCWQDDGSLTLQVRLGAEAGVLVLRALQAAEDAESRGSAGVPRTGEGTRDGRLHVSAETSSTGPGASSCPPAGMQADASMLPGEDTSQRASEDTPAQRRADALVQIAEGWLAQGDRALSGPRRQAIVVHVDAGALGADMSHDPHRCEIEHGPSVAVETARRLACDALRVTIAEDAHGNTLDVGRSRRTVPTALARALHVRDQATCRFPGCTHRHALDAHHRVHWADGGETRLDNLLLLCRRHHRQVHEGGVCI